MPLPLDYIIRSIIKKYYDQGKPDKIRTDGVDEIKKVIKREGGLWKDYQSKIYPLTQEIGKEISKNFIDEHKSKINIIDKQTLTGIIQKYEKKLSDREEEIFRTVRRAIAKATEEKKSWQEVARRMLGKIKLEDRHINTEINTTEAALNNLSRFKQFESSKSEDLFLRYSGPISTRPFCESHVNRVYSLEQVKGMTNDFNEPAYVYCGGYNCRHRWDPVKGSMENNNLFIDRSWQETYDKANSGDTKKLIQEKRTSQILSSLGHKVELNMGYQESKSGDTDVFFDGKPTQLKTPISFSHKALTTELKSYQADINIIRLDQPVDQPERAMGSLKNWLTFHPGKSAFILYNYDEIKLVKVKNG